MTNANTQLQLELRMNAHGSFSEQERQFVLRNLHLNNKELAITLGRTEGSVRNFLSKSQIRRTDEQRNQLYQRFGQQRQGENNPNFKNWRSLNNIYYKHRSIANWPERHKARLIYHAAVRRGEVIPKVFCERCGTTGVKIEAHHPSYLPGEELNVIHCCKQCHSFLDDERRALEAAVGNDELTRPGTSNEQGV